ncbi:lactonase family protein [Limosilactobacillus caecicola]|uniref:lactonase family protein n=1 Tax=Limosilactobacillus caecicola TaxID=2941332 RepID=UPI00203C42A8|nr:lactonase family protein [Limosilactobacillus caecicola]
MTENFLIGTYTDKDSQGLYAITLDTDQEQLINDRLVVKTEKPAYLQVGKNDLVYAIRKEGDLGGVASYKIVDGQATLIDKDLQPGSTPAYLGLDEKDHLMFTANYHTADVKVYKLNDDGTFTLTDTVTHKGVTGPRPEQVDGPHPHIADLTPDGRLAVCDLGLDLLVVYNISDDGKLTAVSQFKFEPGYGPRHFVFHPNGKYAYVLGELSSLLTTFKYNPSNASFTEVQKLKTIPDDWTAHNGAAAIHITKDGRFIYTTNRGENTIAVFAVKDDGTLEHLQSISTEGDFPRDFELSTDENYLVAANQNTDNLTLYRRDPETGKLTMLQKDVDSPQGICVKKWN